MRIFVTGPCGAGKTTMGRLLANALECSAFDLDDLFHLPSDPPFQSSRPEPDRIALAHDLFVPKPDWVLSGNGLSWIAPIQPYFDLVVLLTLKDLGTRIARLTARERARFGARIDAGGDMQATHQKFMEWVAAVDGETVEIQMRHKAWLPQLTCPAITVDADRDRQSVLHDILQHIPA